jgi:hypothetical protein
MNHTLSSRLSQFMTHFQVDLWDWQQDDPLELTPKLINVIKVLEFVEIERFVRRSIVRKWLAPLSPKRFWIDRRRRP